MYCTKKALKAGWRGSPESKLLKAVQMLVIHVCLPVLSLGCPLLAEHAAGYISM